MAVNTVLLSGTVGAVLKMAYFTIFGSEVESSDRFSRHYGAAIAEMRRASSVADSEMRKNTPTELRRAKRIREIRRPKLTLTNSKWTASQRERKQP